MKRVLVASAVLLSVLAVSNRAQNTVTVFEGARVIVGDGSAPIENAAVVV